MRRKKETRTAAVCLAAAVIVARCLTIDCHRLKKSERRGGRRMFDMETATSVQEGKIVFGGGAEELEPQVGDSSNASVKDGPTSQANFAGWTKGKTLDATSTEASWKRLATSLQCGGDQMRFRAVGPGVSQFALEQGDAPPVPLSQVPVTCGYRMHRNCLGLVMLVPYDGCNVVKEGGSYLLPMRWQGIPISLSCPEPSPVVSESTMATTDIPLYRQYPHPFFPYIPPFFPVTTAAPTTATTTTTTTTKAAGPAAHHPVHRWPFPSLYAPYPWDLPQPLPAAAKSPVIHTNHHKPNFLPFPGHFPFYPYFPYHFFPPYAQYPTPMPTTTTTKKMHPVHHHRHFPPSVFKYPFVLEHLHSR